MNNSAREPGRPLRLARCRLIVAPGSGLKKVVPPFTGGSVEYRAGRTSTRGHSRRLAVGYRRLTGQDEAGIFARPESLAGTHESNIAKYDGRIEPTDARFQHLPTRSRPVPNADHARRQGHLTGRRNKRSG